MDSMEELLLEQLRDLHSAERQIKAALPKMAKAAASEDLRAAFEEHLEQTLGQIERLDRAFELLESKPGRHKCKGMEGLLEEGAEMIKEKGDPDVKDAGLIAAAQRVEHYEIAGYGSARTFAEMVGQKDIADLLQETLDEEKATDEKLTELAMSSVNPAAA